MKFLNSIVCYHNEYAYFYCYFFFIGITEHRVDRTSFIAANKAIASGDPGEDR